MASTTKRLQAVAASMLTHVGDDIRDIDFELMTVGKELEMLTVKMDDAMWAGDSDKVNGVFYQIMLKRMIRAILQKRRKVKMREMVE